MRTVQIVGRGDVDDVDVGIGEEVVERGIGAGDAQGGRPGRTALWRAAEHAANLDADPAQGFDVDGADEARADDGGADVGDRPHALIHLLAGPAICLDILEVDARRV